MEENDIARSFGEEGRPLVCFPPGEPLLAEIPLRSDLWARVDELLGAGRCAEGRLELEAAASRLTCLIHDSEPFLAGLLEGDVYSRVPLYDFALRAAQLEGAVCSLVRTDLAQVMMAAVHFAKRPMLQASTRLVDPAHVLRVLAEERQDAALSFERAGARTLLFLKDGRPARLYFGDPRDDPKEGTLEERVLLYAFSPSAPETRVEVFTNLKIRSDPDAGVPLAVLAEAARPCPPATVFVHMTDGREVRQRPFSPPEMIIGRDPAATIFIDNLAVSRRHARLLWERGGFVVEDLGSANGTLLNGQPVERSKLAPGDRVGVGKFEVTIVEEPAAPEVPGTLFLPSRKAPPPGYLVGDGVSLPLARDLLLGRGRGVDVAVRGLFVRPVHARIERDDGGELRIRCFGGAKVAVNGRKVQSSPLGPGDELAVGRSSFRISERE